MSAVFKIAKQQQARVLLVGDPLQHSSVNSGKAHEIIQQYAGIKPARIQEIRRQSGDYKKAVSALSKVMLKVASTSLTS